MNIEAQKMVTLSYTLRVDEKNGEIIEKTSDNDPLKFIYGMGSMLPKFESNLSGLKQGDDFKMSLSASDAYGEFDEEAVVDLPKDIFVIDGVFDEDRFSVGAKIPMQTANGQRMNGTILEVEDDSLKMDFNHPLAGVDLFFEGKILEVRDATDDELNAMSGCGSCSGSCGSGHSECSDDDCGCSGGCGC